MVGVWWEEKKWEGAFKTYVLSDALIFSQSTNLTDNAFMINLKECDPAYFLVYRVLFRVFIHLSLLPVSRAILVVIF